ncbi:DoxX family protein [Flagellimonas hadalis]|uniref:DoxX family protein n=1 Tax=Flagellimonas hadalis TaxID=2597517 RepID=UPI003AADEB42
MLLIAPVKDRIKDWAYAGFAFTFVSAALAHISVGDPIALWLAPLVFLVLLTISYALFVKGVHRIKKSNNQ